jgi:succinylglutamate desuccinylase
MNGRDNEMLNILDHIPDGLLHTGVERLHQILPGPTLIHLPGRRKKPLFVSILLHGNEETGLLAIQALLRKYKELPRELTVFIGNVEAARYRKRWLDHQQDYNRIWKPGDTPEHKLAEKVTEIMRSSSPFACIDLHNNTGINPHHAAVNQLDNRSLQLANLFSRKVVYTITPQGTLSAAFAGFCSAVTIECGKASHAYGTEHALEFLEGCLHLADVPDKPVHEHDLDLFHITTLVKVPVEVSFGFGEEEAMINFIEDLDHLNFRELYQETVLARVKPGISTYLEAWDEQGNEVADKYFTIEDNEIRLTQKVMPAMLTMDREAIRQDCLCYLMERYQNKLSAPNNGSSTS